MLPVSSKLHNDWLISFLVGYVIETAIYSRDEAVESVVESVSGDQRVMIGCNHLPGSHGGPSL